VGTTVLRVDQKAEGVRGNIDKSPLCVCARARTRALFTAVSSAYGSSQAKG